MKRGLAVVYTVVTVVFFLAVAAVLLVRLGSVREENLSAARQEFRQLQSAIARNVRETDLPISRAVQASFREVARRDTRIAAFSAYGFRQEGVEYLWARDRRMVQTAGSEPPGFDYDGLSQARLTGTVQLPDTDPLMVEGIYTVLRREDVFTLLRDSLIAVLAFALIAVVLAIVSLLAPGSRRRAVGAPPTEPGAHAGRWTEEGMHPAPSSARENRKSRTEAGPTLQPHASGPEPPGHPEPTSSPEAGLFSPESGVSPESHLEKRLSLELERAAANDQDLSICFVEYPGLTRGSESYRSIASGLLHFFGFEDLIFEYGKSGFCVLFPNVELNEAIHLVEDFQKRRPETGSAEEAQGGRGAQRVRGPSQPLFGLSSRNGRLVEGWRLMREARQALAKARNTRGRIMAFKPDPQRYRQFISEKPGAG
jgi:hypothetical protein